MLPPNETQKLSFGKSNKLFSGHAEHTNYCTMEKTVVQQEWLENYLWMLLFLGNHFN